MTKAVGTSWKQQVYMWALLDNFEVVEGKFIFLFLMFTILVLRTFFIICL